MSLVNFWGRLSKWMTLAASLVVFGAGCGDRPDKGEEADVENPEVAAEEATVEEAAEAPPVQEDPFQELFEEANALFNGGKTNELVELLLTAFDEEKYAEVRPRVFDLSQRALVIAGRVEDAEKRFLDVAAKEVETVEASLGFIFGHKYRAGDTNALYEWSMKLIDLPLSTNSLQQVYSWHLEACVQAGEISRVFELVPVVGEKFGSQGMLSAYRRIVSMLVGTQKLDEADRLVGLMASTFSDDDAVKMAVKQLRVDLMLARRQWSEAEQAFKGSYAQMSDGEANSMFRKIVAAAQREDEFDVADRLCEFVMATSGNKASVMQGAVRWYSEIPERKGAPTLIPVRLRKMLDTYHVSAESLAPVFNRKFYTVMGTGDKASLSKMLAVGESMVSAVAEESLKGEIRVRLVDGYFSKDDFEKALVQLEQGIPGREDWVKIAKVKTRAHVAQGKKQYAESVKCYREFMGMITNDTFLGADPSTGIKHTVKMCYGLNAKRIGDIWTEAGETAKAKAAYREAVEYYQQALGEADDGSREHDYIKSEQIKIPGAAEILKQLESEAAAE